MKGFVSGLIVGVLIGAGGTYAALTKSWEGSGTVAVAVPDAAVEDGKGKKKKKRKKRRRRKRSSDTGPVDQIVELSAADRQLIWKGQAVRLPPKEVDFSGDSGRVLNQSEIDDGIASGASAVARCIGDARGNAELSATITLKMLVGPNGKVSKRRVRAPRYLQDNGLFGCVSKATGRMRFAGTGAATVVTVPFDLN